MNEDRRTLMKLAGLAGAGVMLDAVGAPLALAQNVSMATSKTVDTSVLRIGYEDSGDAAAFPVILLHGFPDDARAYDGVVPPLVQAGYRLLCWISAGTDRRDSWIPRQRAWPSRRP